MRTRMLFAAVPALLLCAAGARADVYDFSYVGVTDADVFGSGTFTTGTPYSDGYVPIIAITGFNESGTITGLETEGGAGIDPNSPNAPLTCCQVGPDQGFGSLGFNYDNAFLPNSPNPFSSDGLLFEVAAGNGPTGYPLSPVNIFGGSGGVIYEENYGENTPVDLAPDYGATPIRFTASLATPEPSFYGAVGLCMSGLLFVRWRRGRGLSDKMSSDN